MAGHPTAEQFDALAKAAERYGTQLYPRLLDMPFEDCTDETSAEQKIAELAALAADASDEAWELSFGEHGFAAFEWMNNQPSFLIANQALGFVQLDEERGWQPRFESMIRRRLTRNKLDRWMTASKISNTSGQYLRYVSGVASAAHGYITGMSSRAALEGPATVERMKSLLSELEHLIAAEWLPEESKKKLSYLLKVQRATSYLESADVFASPASRRNDNDLPSRLMASELIRLNQEMFSAAHKRAVFQLMGLSFIERPLEMRTIERLIRAEKERRQRIKMPGKVESV